MLPLLSGPGSNGNEGVLHIPQSSSTTEASPSDCLVSYPGHLLGGVLPLCRDVVGIFYGPCRLGQFFFVFCIMVDSLPVLAYICAISANRI